MGTTEEKLAYLEETKEKLAQGLTAKGVTPAATFRGMAEQVAEIPGGTPLPPLTNPGTAADLLSGKQLIDGTGRVVTGSMPDIVPQRMELESGQTYTIPRGYHSGSGIITAKGGAGGSFSVPLVVTVEAGATVTATNGADTVTGVSDGTATLILPSGGTWTITATKEGTTFYPTEIVIPNQYATPIYAVSKLPEGYTILEYISNPNLTYCYPNFGSYDIQKGRLELEIDIGQEILSTNAYRDIMGWTYQRTGAAYGQIFRVGFTKNVSDVTVQVLQKVAGSSYLTTTSIENVDRNGLIKIIVDIPKKYFKVNSMEVTLPANTDASANYIAYNLFASSLRDDKTNYFGQNRFNFKLYSLNIFASTEEETGELLYEFIPCIDPNGVAGLYEFIEGKFIAGQGGVFEAGPSVIK